MQHRAVPSQGPQATNAALWDWFLCRAECCQQPPDSQRSGDRAGSGGRLGDSPAGQEPRGVWVRAFPAWPWTPGSLHPEALLCGDANSCLSRGAPEWRQQILRSGWQHPGHTDGLTVSLLSPQTLKGTPASSHGLSGQGWNRKPGGRIPSCWIHEAILPRGRECTRVRRGVAKPWPAPLPQKPHRPMCPSTQAQAHMHTHLHACMETDAACVGNSEAQKDAEGPPQALSPSWGTSVTK